MDVLTVYVVEPHPNASRSPYQRAWPDFSSTGWREWWNGYATSIINTGGRRIPTFDPPELWTKHLTDEGPWVNHPLFQPRTFKERVHQAASLIRHYSCTAHPITTPVLIDEMDNRFWCSYGYLPNSAFLIKKDGTIAFRESWFAPKGTDGKPNLTNIKAAIEALP